ncbi:MAG: CoA-binding protein [Terriglobia bacterium]
MSSLKESVDDFLAQKRIAIAGVSRQSKNEAANFIYRKLRDSGYQVFPVNPNATTVEDTTCYPDLKSLPMAVDGVVIVTPPRVTEQIVHECADLGIPRVWIHRSMGQGSVSKAASAFCHEHHIAVISGGCPMMFCAPVDFGHKCMGWIVRLTGGMRG